MCSGLRRPQRDTLGVVAVWQNPLPVLPHASLPAHREYLFYAVLLLNTQSICQGKNDNAERYMETAGRGNMWPEGIFELKWALVHSHESAKIDRSYPLTRLHFCCAGILGLPLRAAHPRPRRVHIWRLLKRASSARLGGASVRRRIARHDGI